jgi:hypothetical protein
MQQRSDRIRPRTARYDTNLHAGSLPAHGWDLAHATRLDERIDPDGRRA